MQVVQQIGADHRALAVGNDHDALVAPVPQITQQRRIPGEDARARRLAVRRIGKVVVDVQHPVDGNAKAPEGLREPRAEGHDGQRAAGQPLAGVDQRLPLQHLQPAGQRLHRGWHAGSPGDLLDDEGEIQQAAEDRARRKEVFDRAIEPANAAAKPEAEAPRPVRGAMPQTLCIQVRRRLELLYQ